MADLDEAFHVMNNRKNIQNIDHFFTQRSLIEEQEFIDKNMTRKTNNIKVVHNFLAINIPINDTGNIGTTKPCGFDIEIFGDKGYRYKGTVETHHGICPNFIVPIKGDKKMFININYKFTDNDTNTFKEYTSFIEVPKRFQMDQKNDAIEKS